MSDSTVTVSFFAGGSATPENGRLVHVVVVRQTEKSKREQYEAIVTPLLILFTIASLLVYFLLKVKATSRVNSTLDKIENKIPRFLRF
jgi:uncharacterized membrane protein